MEALDLIATSRALLDASVRRPRESDLRRAISTVYYALFHCLAECCADTLVGGKRADRTERAWLQVFRALEHGAARDRCNSKKLADFPKRVQDLGNAFVGLQKRRRDADYNPAAQFSKLSVTSSVRLKNLRVRSRGSRTCPSSIVAHSQSTSCSNCGSDCPAEARAGCLQAGSLHCASRVSDGRGGWRFRRRKLA